MSTSPSNTMVHTPSDDDDFESDLPDGLEVPTPNQDPSEPVGGPKPDSAMQASTRFDDVISGEFDAEQDASTDEAEPPRRVLPAMPDSPKLHKVLAQSGMGSRLDMERLITEGRITVNNEPAHLGQRIQFGDHVKVNGKPIRVRIEAPAARVIAYHKPVGEVVTHDDPQNRPTVFRKLPRLNQGKWQSVGRLDINTEGLLLFTSSGDLANRLMHPRFGLEREYAVRVLGALSEESMQRLRDGVTLDDGQARVEAIVPGGAGEGANCWYRVTLREGRNREVRRLFEAVGHAVSRLIRIRYGVVVLPRGLRRGQWVELDMADIKSLTQATQGAAQGGRRGNGSGRSRGGPGPQDGPGDGSGGRRRGPRTNLLRGMASRNGASQGTKRRDRGAGGDSGRPPAGQPDPMKTSFGYIGADSFMRQRSGGQRPGGDAGGGRGRRRGYR